MHIVSHSWDTEDRFLFTAHAIRALHFRYTNGLVLKYLQLSARFSLRLRTVHTGPMHQASTVVCFTTTHNRPRGILHHGSPNSGNLLYDHVDPLHTCQLTDIDPNSSNVVLRLLASCRLLSAKCSSGTLNSYSSKSSTTCPISQSRVLVAHGLKSPYQR